MEVAGNASDFDANSTQEQSILFIVIAQGIGISLGSLFVLAALLDLIFVKKIATRHYLIQSQVGRTQKMSTLKPESEYLADMPHTIYILCIHIDWFPYFSRAPLVSRGLGPVCRFLHRHHTTPAFLHSVSFCMEMHGNIAHLSSGRKSKVKKSLGSFHINSYFEFI